MQKNTQPASNADLLIPDIEAELAKLFQKQNAGKQIKACLFTLIIYSSQPQRTQYLQDLADTILEKFPCRIIFIQCSKKEAADHLHVDVSSITSGSKESLVVCDRISIDASQSQLERIPFLVLPHIVADLPVYLLWGQNPFQEKVIFPRLQPYASRVLFDSQCSENLNAFCQEMLKNLKESKLDLMDINWALLSNWRDLITQLFDTKERLDQLRTTKSIQISYNHLNGDFQNPAIRAIYLQGWLAAHLKWNFQSYEKIGTTQIFAYTTTQSIPVIIALTPNHFPHLPEGSLTSIDIKTHDGHRYQITRNEKLPQAVVHVSAKEKCEIPFTLPLPDLHQGLNFMREIFFYHLSDHYRNMLNTIAKTNKNCKLG